MDLKKLITIASVVLIVHSVSCQVNHEYDFTNFNDKADDYMKAIVNRTDFSGTVLVAYKDSIVFHNSYGLASRRFLIQNNSETKYRAGSITKSLTAILILQLVEKGTISLDDYIVKYLDYPFGDQIQIKHLLSHTSGIKRDIDFPDNSTAYKLEELVKLSNVDSLIYPPGTKSSYSNCGYILLHALLEKTTGKDYESLLKTEILDPLEMNNSGIENPELPPINLADGYGAGIDSNGNLAKVEQKLLSHGYSDAVGALYTTSTDLLKFCQSLGNPMFLKKEIWDLAFTPSLNNSNGYNWGLGFNIIKRGTKTILNHNGRTTGFRGGYFHSIDDELTIIVLANNSEAERESIVNTFHKILNNEDYYVPKTFENENIEFTVEDYTGTYKTEYFPFDILSHNNELFVSSHGDPPTKLIPYARDKFYTKFFDLNLEFKRKNKIVISCEWNYQNSPMNAVKQ